MDVNNLEKQSGKTKKNLKIIGIIVGIIIVIGIIGIIIYFVAKKSSTSNPANTQSRKVLGGSCAITSDCDTNLTCDNRICKTYCKLNSDCSGGRICSSSNACVDTTTNRCSSNENCQSGQVCINGTCTVSPSCTADIDCASNSLAKKCINSICVQCNSDTNCPSGQKCNNGSCVIGGTNDTAPKMYRLLTTHGFASETGLNVDMMTITGTVEDCKVRCDRESSCKGFTRPTNLEDNEKGDCYLKSGPMDNNKLYSNVQASNDSGAMNSWVKINKHDTFIPATGPTDNTYLKSTNQYIDKDKYSISQVTGTLSKCIEECNKNTSCRGFNRVKSYNDTDSTGICYLKSTNIANVNNLESDTNKYNSWVNISVPEQVVSSGNFGCSGTKFCGQDWNNEFPYTWGGARCAGIISSDGKVNGSSCNETVDVNRSVICQRDDNIGFLQRSGGGCNNPNTDRVAITGTSVDEPQNNTTYDYYKKANNITDRILKIKTSEPNNNMDGNQPNRDALCNSWCKSEGNYNIITGQNEFQKDLQNSWKRTDNNCLFAATTKNFKDRDGTIRSLATCNEAVKQNDVEGNPIKKNCVCLKRV